MTERVADEHDGHMTEAIYTPRFRLSVAVFHSAGGAMVTGPISLTQALTLPSASDGVGGLATRSCTLWSAITLSVAQSQTLLTSTDTPSGICP